MFTIANIVQLSNAALSLLGDSPITSLEDDTTRARLCKSFWPIVRDDVLREHPWKCALKRTSLALLVAVPVFGFSNQFQLPGDCIRVIGIDDDYGDIRWQREGNKILADSTSMKILYVYRLEDSAQYDPILTMCMVFKLAMVLASAITDKVTMIEGLSKLYSIELNKARPVNAQEASSQAFESNVLTEVR